MIRVQSRPLRLVAAGLTLAVLGVACGTPEKKRPSRGSVAETTTTTVPRGPDTTAAQLRSSLNALLQEHVYLAGAAASAVSGGRGEEVSAFSGALDGNSNSLSENFLAIFGETDGAKFGELWKKHVGSFVAYTQGSGQASADLAQYARDFGAYINSILPSLPADAVTNLSTQHEQTLKAAIDAMRGGNHAQAYTNLRNAAAHMMTVASGLTGAITKKLPDKIPGDPASKAADLLTNLNVTLQEHVFLAAAAASAVVGGRGDEAAGARAALDANTDALTKLVSAAYGPEAGNKFNPLWKKHIGFVVDYATAVAAKQQAKADEAMDNLLSYTEEFGAFINTASPKLTPDAVANLVKTHILTLKDVIDAQAARNFAKAATGVRTAANHMATIATNLATTIVAQFPQNY